MDSPKDALARIKRGFAGPLIDRDSHGKERRRADSLCTRQFGPVPSYGFKDAGIEATTVSFNVRTSKS